MLKNIQYYQRVILLVWLGVSAGFAQAATDCNQVTEIPVSECQSLLELYNSTNGVNWTNNTGWNQTNTPCSWFGMGCYGGHILTLYLGNNNLTGGLNNLNLPSLQFLHLYSNQLNSRIPDFNFPELIDLRLNSNQLIGNIPNFNLPKLRQLYLGENQLTGNIPNFNSPELVDLRLNSNKLGGSIPDFNLPKLYQLFLYENQLTGNIPNFNLPELEYLYLYSNQLSGNIPDFNRLSKLYSLALNSNQLSGNIPNFSNLFNLKLLWLNSNQLTGKILFNVSSLLYAYFNINCGLVASDSNQESILNQKDPSWKTRNPNCPVSYYNLTLNKTGNGQISGGGSFTANSTVNLSATPDSGYIFNGWSPNPCNSSFLMPANDLTCTATFSQGCNYSLNPTVANHSANAENGSFNVTVTNGCNWSASSNQSWVRITNPSDSGSAAISYSVDANPNTIARSTIISINGQSFTVNQAAKKISLIPDIRIEPTTLNF